jgi:AraC-like DNA-binding protein
MFNSGRSFSVLSFRLCSDAVLTTKTETHVMKSHSVSYFPAMLDYTRAATVDEMIAIHFDTTDYHTQRIECFDAKQPEKLARLFRAILACWKQKEIGYPYRCSAILYEILAECYAQNFVAEAQSSKIQGSVEYLLTNFKKCDLSIKEIAERSFISEVYFRKLFKDAYGVSPQKYIIDLRIQNAVALMSAGYYSLKEIAYLSGYHDYKYFSVEFKKRMGVSPSEYIDSYAHGHRVLSSAFAIPEN